MKKLIIVFMITLFNIFGTMNVFAEETEKVVVYFYSDISIDSNEVNSYIDGLINEGITVTKYNIKEEKNINLLYNYSSTYNLPTKMAKVPLIFSGDKYFAGKDEIISGLNNGNIQLAAENSLLEVIEKKVVIYFYSETCTVCNATGPIINTLVDDGINLIKYNILNESENINLMYSYAVTYRVPQSRVSVPLIFSGEKYYQGQNDITKGIENGDLQLNASNALKYVDPEAYKLFVKLDFLGTLYIMFSGFLDGFNPCALAMLLMFISLLGFTTKKRILISVSVSYILGLFLTYFALGTILYSVLGSINIGPIALFINIFIITISIILVVYNFHDFFVTKKEEYGKVKNQLPKGIQKFNKKLIKYFSQKLDEKSKLIYILPFILGIIISLTEFLCTGQIYLPVIISLIQFSDTLNLSAILYLLMYNLFFILPLVIVAVVAIKSTSVLGASNKIRENLHWIKLANAILFLAIAIYYLLVVFGIL